jgi:hypothetical protein
MTTWVLIIIFLTREPGVPTVATVPGYTSLKLCHDAGVALNEDLGFDPKKNGILLMWRCIPGPDGR